LKFSIIVPVYNREKSIRKCIDSILAQNFTNYELLITDDGSTDNTWLVLSEYKAQRDNIRIFRQNNSGVSSARNVGLVNAVGKYVIFVDSDDWIAPGYLEYLESVLTSDEVDGVILDYYVDSADKESIKANSTASFPREIGASEYRRMFLGGEIKNCMWDKVIRREIFLKGSICFPESISICEDAVVTASIGNFIKNLKVTDNAFLHYVENKGSLSRYVTTISTVHQILEALVIMEKVFYDSSPDISNINEMKLRQLFYYVMTLKIFSKSEKNEVFRKFFTIVDSLSLKKCQSRRSKIYLVFARLTKVPGLRNLLFASYRLMKNRASL
jgi:glycosyltransferase involved in cell wall biosynthesis